MRTAHLLRHAKSSWGEAGLADQKRPLAPRGRRDAARMAHRLAELDAPPNLVLCSSAVRTQQTLALIRPALGQAALEVSDDLYGASAAELLSRLGELPDEIGSVLVIGHNPGLQDLALELAAGGDQRPQLEAKFPTCALATLEFQGRWGDLAAGACELTGFVIPRELD
jgi:phosphohistidine phosphatase